MKEIADINLAAQRHSIEDVTSINKEELLEKEENCTKEIKIEPSGDISINLEELHHSIDIKEEDTLINESGLEEDCETNLSRQYECGNATDNMEEADSEVLLSPMLMDIPTPLASPATSKGIRSEGIQRKRKRKTTEVEDSFLLQASSTLQMLARTNEPPQQDVWDGLGKFVAYSLRGMKRNQTKCKHAILKVIMQFEEEEDT